MRWTIFWIVAVIATLWNLLGLYTFASAFSQVQDVPPAQLAFIESLPSWRWISWGLGVAASVAGSLALLMGRGVAQHLFWLTVVLMILGFAYDMLVADAVTHMGSNYPWFTGGLVVVEILFALYARWAAGQGMLKRP